MVTFQSFNILKRVFHPLQTITAGLPWDRFAVDLETLLPVSYDTLVVNTDIFTKFTILKFLKGKVMEQVARALWETIGPFGGPKIIQSNNGPEFVSQFVKELGALESIDHRTISQYNNRPNSSVERVNATVEAILKKELDGAMHVTYVQLAQNSKIAALTGFTPFSLMLGGSVHDFENYCCTKRRVKWTSC